MVSSPPTLLSHPAPHPPPLPEARPLPVKVLRFKGWRDETTRAILYQVLVAGAVIALVSLLIGNTLDNLARRSIATGFNFLEYPASFAISETMISYSPADSYARAFLVGLLNTLKTAVLGIVLATLLGTIIGLARLSSNWLVSRLAAVYIEIIRNIPPILQLFFWYSLFTEGLPRPRQALNPLPGVFISNRGLLFPIPEPHWVWSALPVAVGMALFAIWMLRRWSRQRQARTGQRFPLLWTSLGLFIGLPLALWGIAGAPQALNQPVLVGFNFSGGATLTPEFSALVVGLVTYTAAFIAEIVRSGILGVNPGQTEAGLAIGLRRSHVLRLIILPQALRIIVPPITGQYLNLTKNSSLAVAIGYPDLVSVLNTTINQTGQAIEGVAMIMAVYLTISLSIAGFMNWYNRHIALIER
jgi:general L-amino acid transport system permease protein